MLLGVSVHAAFEQFLYFFQKKKKTTSHKNSLFRYRNPEGLKSQEEKVGGIFLSMCLLVLSILTVTS